MPADRPSGFSSAFDEMLERSRRELDALSGGSDAPALSPTPRTPPRMPPRTPPRTSLQTPSRTFPEPSGGRSSAPDRNVSAGGASASSPAASRSPAERALDEKLGADWRYEVLERTREGGEVIVRCRVTAPSRGISRTWFGSAPVAGRGHRASSLGRGASGMKGRAGNVSFTLGAGAGTGPGTSDSARSERQAERQAVESALAACARLL